MANLFQTLALLREFVDKYYDSNLDVFYEFGDLAEEAEKMIEPRPLTLERTYEIAQKEGDIDTIIGIECNYERSRYE